MIKYFNNILITLSQLINSVFGGHPDETIAARCHRGAFKRNLFCQILEIIINKIFFWQDNHCALMHEQEVEDSQNSEDYEI